MKLDFLGEETLARIPADYIKENRLRIQAYRKIASISELPEVAALRTGTATGSAAIDALTGLIREAAANAGKVADATWKAAQRADWSDEQLADAFANLGATVFTAYFLNYSETERDR